MLTLAEAEAAAAVLERWCDGYAGNRERDAALAILKRARASGVKENIGRFKSAARRNLPPGMNNADLERRAVAGIVKAIGMFKTAGHSEI